MSNIVNVLSSSEKNLFWKHNRILVICLINNLT